LPPVARMQRFASILDQLGKALFVVGFLLVCTVGTATEIPFHLFGLPLCAAGALALAGARLAQPERRPPPLALAVAFSLACGYFFWRAAVSPVRHLGEMDMFLVAALVLGFLAGRASGSMRWLVPWLVLVLLGGLAVSFQQVTADERFTILGHWNLGRPEGMKAASGFFHNYNPYGSWSALGVSVFLAALVGGGGRSGKWWLRVLAATGLAAAAAGVFLSFSRAAFLGTVVGASGVMLLFFLALSGWRAGPWKKAGAFAGGLVLAGLLAWLVQGWIPVLAEKRGMDASLEGLEKHLEGRENYWATGISQFLDSQIFGGGGRSYSYLSYQFWDMPVNTADPYYAHSEYVQALADYGLVGLLLGVGLAVLLLARAMVVAFATGRRDTTASGRARVTLWLAVAGVTLAAAGDAFFSFSLHFAPHLLLIGFIAGVGSAHDRISGDERKTQLALRLAGGSVIAALALAAAAVVIWPGGGYALTTFRAYEADAAWLRRDIDTDTHRERILANVAILPRYPVYYKAGETCLDGASRGGLGPEARDALLAQAENWFTKALVAFPASVEALMLRSQARWSAGKYGPAEEDLLKATQIGRAREPVYRCMMLVGELRYARALDRWRGGDLAGASASLASALAAYDEAARRTWPNARGRDGQRQVKETIEFLKRTGEWRDP
jgi:O-antigen ligase